MNAALQSLYAEAAPKIPFKCSWGVSKVYNDVCMCSGRALVINYKSTFAVLGDLVDLVKSEGRLKNTIAEVSINVLNGKNKRGATRFVMPLYVTIFFPVIQQLVENNEHSGHYFFIVLNFRNKRFELLDSLRTRGYAKLEDCCNKIMAGIKTLWGIHYGDTNHDIENYELVDIGVAKQTNNHDCDFHMLLHAEFCDGHYVYTLKEKDISNIRKILTHKWLNHFENDADWENILNLN
ncbi:hypothetical protein PVAP13_7KG246700 [Panicum virgatum]|uniref:Ubiquitin-like protease family profile domain-containing protein n=1 Tax=Panicum virgatum TaxID=38727 RepID=A0A8T0QHQ0_PANVG|nr:hypothetical protein PVAP13_7KG246700 [Panicum virgatum]